MPSYGLLPFAGMCLDLSTDGSVLLAGAQRQNGAGDAYVMERNGATWSANPTNPTTTALASSLPGSMSLTSGDYFGSACGLSGDGSFASVGALLYPGGSGPGAALTFSEGSANQWAYDANITPNGLQNYDAYGYALSVASDALTVVVGACYTPAGSGNGAAYVSDFY